MTDDLSPDTADRDAIWQQFNLTATVFMFRDYCRRQADPKGFAEVVLDTLRERMIEEIRRSEAASIPANPDAARAHTAATAAFTKRHHEQLEVEMAKLREVILGIVAAESALP